MTRPVYTVGLADPPLSALAPGDVCRVSGNVARHAVVSRRLRVGEQLDLVDGAGLRVSVDVIEIDGPTYRARATAVVREPAPSPRLVLVQALAKNKRDQQAVESACEIGVDAIYPWTARRCIVTWKKADAVKSQRWFSTVLSACEQSRRARRPDLEALVSTGDLVAAVRAARERGEVVFVAHEVATQSLPSILAEAEAAPGYWVIVGPEGGITEDEITTLCEAGAQPIRMGPTVMRTSTAGVAALSVIAAHVGRWDTAEGTHE
ncbi:16S rRNA (uracil(1498)-N(3))-methyltransferase [Nanchangia anserum]|uniref:Ribosomal RNA small subunit methyltransferase E n=1 Tax=Nanchangia anserum TaxID=2692125 RepID=A0A8I0KR53_9ACTO|nr:16S rRNA (uracil(1498)-N(3))-methyltransferase [Nanchangia anserum]MBD3689092.1 16S rRNA (uracil(1498)-N(3))-methyltransferase [Nanchangia anserum]QOX81330.1 16S rRNA (uracil(1498)-N(3))-methyltransferase [Nanchangia anserum]